MDLNENRKEGNQHTDTLTNGSPEYDDLSFYCIQLHFKMCRYILNKRNV